MIYYLSYWCLISFIRKSVNGLLSKHLNKNLICPLPNKHPTYNIFPPRAFSYVTTSSVPIAADQCGEGPQGKAVSLSRLPRTEMTPSLSQSRSFSSNFVLTDLPPLCAVFMCSTCLSTHRFGRGTNGNQFPSCHKRLFAATHVSSSLLICFTTAQQICSGSMIV